MTSLQPQGNAVVVKNGDELTVQYVDDFPADFRAFQEEKKFGFVMVIGVFDTAGVFLAKPELTASPDDSGEISAGQQVALSSTVRSPFDTELTFVAILEIRDSNDITVFIGWQSGTLHRDSPAEIGMSWIPQDRGEYEARMFIVSDLQNPRVLSGVTSSQVTVTA
jgi:hypothetical protein